MRDRLGPPRTAAHAVWTDRGIALPSALIALTVLLALAVALVALTSAEPTIAANQVLSTRARSLAESGLERALWALSHPGAAAGIADPMPSSPAPAPYDGVPGSFRALEVVDGASLGGFVVAVTHAASGLAHERDLAAVGYVPDAAHPRAVKKIRATAMRVKWLAPPCALCLGGESPTGATSALQLGARATVNASTAAGIPPASYCSSQAPSSAIMSTGVVSTQGTPDVVAPPGGEGTVQGAPATVFASFTLTDADLAVLKGLARDNATYYRGAQRFTSPPPDGIVFIDTPSGNPLTASSPAADLFTVDIEGAWASGWRGWLIVAGGLRMRGQIDMTGLIYVQSDLHYQGQGNGRLRGAIIASNRLDVASNQVDADELGAGALTYDCPAVRDGGGTIPQHWFLKPGSYREVAGL
jgi:hypothetical protein